MKFNALEASIPPSGTQLAAVDAEHDVVIYDFQREEIVTSFESNHKWGGRRLAFSQDADACLTGSYHEYHIGCTDDCGIACYSPAGGERRWLRSDLKRVQNLQFLSSSRVFAGFNDGVACILDPATGKTIEQCVGVKRMWEGGNGEVVRELEDKVSMTSSAGRTLEHELRSFAVLDAAVHAKGFLISEAGGSVRCFSTEGDELWQYDPPQGSHVLYFGIGPDAAPIGVEWAYQSGGEYLLLDFSNSVVKRLGVFEKPCLGILPGTTALIRRDLTQVLFA